VGRIAAEAHLEQTNSVETAREVILIALDHLTAIHDALTGGFVKDTGCELLFSSENRRIIDGLLDLITLEGIYPRLGSGVGVPIQRRVNSILQGDVSATLAEDNVFLDDDEILLQVVTRLHAIAISEGQGVSSPLRERIIVDLIAAELQLEHDPKNPSFESGMLDDLIGR
jgi:hypothetical protein